MFMRVLDLIGWILLAPFRLIGWTVAMLGRAFGLFLGFGLMVAGVAFWAGSVLILGIPLFVVGLLLTLRALG